MSIVNIRIYIVALLATLIGIYGQDLAYFLHRQFESLQPVYVLTIATFLSLVLYTCMFIFIYLPYKRQRISQNTLTIYLSIFGTIALLTSCWSLFVLVSWWG